MRTSKTFFIIRTIICLMGLLYWIALVGATTDNQFYESMIYTDQGVQWTDPISIEQLQYKDWYYKITVEPEQIIAEHYINGIHFKTQVFSTGDFNLIREWILLSGNDSMTLDYQIDDTMVLSKQVSSVSNFGYTYLRYKNEEGTVRKTEIYDENQNLLGSMYYTEEGDLVRNEDYESGQLYFLESPNAASQEFESITLDLDHNQVAISQGFFTDTQQQEQQSQASQILEFSFPPPNRNETMFPFSEQTRSQYYLSYELPAPAGIPEVSQSFDPYVNLENDYIEIIALPDGKIQGYRIIKQRRTHYITYFVYDNYGYLMKQFTYFPTSDKSKKYVFNEDGMVITGWEYSGANLSYIYTYDSKGRIYLADRVSEDGSIIEHIKYFYDQAGNIIQKKIYDNNWQLLRTETP